MRDEWYYRLFGQEFGPLTFDELAALAKADGLGPADAVRHGSEGTWVSARSIGGLFPPLEPAAARAATGDEVFYLLVEDTEYGPIDRDQLHRMADAGRLRSYQQIRPGREGGWIPLPDAAAGLGIEPALIRSPLAASRQRDRAHSAEGQSADGLAGSGGTPSGGSEGASASVDGAIAAAALTADAALAGRGSSQRSGSQRIHRTAVVCLGVAALTAVGVWLLLFAKNDREYYDAISSLYGQFQALREQNAPADRWDEWLKRVEARRRELVSELEATAGAESGKVARQHMLFALRDHITQMRRDSIREPGESEQRFTEHMDSALAHIEDRPLPVSRRPPPPARVGAVDVTLAATALVEFGIVLWLAVGMIRSRKRQAG